MFFLSLLSFSAFQVLVTFFFHSSGAFLLLCNLNFLGRAETSRVAYELSNVTEIAKFLFFLISTWHAAIQRSMTTVGKGKCKLNTLKMHEFLIFEGFYVNKRASFL